jgi:tetratricopeptide (TPR) repeat protein
VSRPLNDVERRCYEIGRRRWERGDRDGALRALERFLETRGEFADVHYMVGMLREQGDDLAAAADSLREALRLNPAYAEAMVALASIYERLGEFSRSRALAERVAQLALPSAGALDATTRGKLANMEAALADAYRAAGALSDAIDGYRKALDRCPTFHDIRYRLAITLREAGFPDRALAELARVRRANPELLDAAVQTGLTLYSLGRGDEAIAEWRAVLARDRTREDARMYLRMVARTPDRATEPAPDSADPA